MFRLFPPQAFYRVGALLLSIAVTVGCSHDSPVAPTPPAQAHATIVITSISVVGERIGAAAAGYVYRVTLHLRESAGMAATIMAVDLTFMNGANTVTSLRHGEPISAGANVPASGAVDTRELITMDRDASHPYATTVLAKVTYTDATSVESTVGGSADIPVLGPPPPVTYTLTGVIGDATRRLGIEGARVEILNGINNGKATTTDSAGTYALTDLLADTFRMRASMSGYDSAEQNVTVPENVRADFTLQRSATASCEYAVAPTGILDVSPAGSQFSLTITRTSGTCGWQAETDASWITLSTSSGSGNAALTFTYRPNPSFVGRLGTVTVTWSGGSRQLTVRQAAETPAFCLVTITVGGQSTIAVPAAGGQYTASIVAVPGVPPGVCSAWTASTQPAITFVGTAFGPTTPGTVTFVVQPNPSPTVRSLWVTINFVSGSPSAVLTVNQSGTP